MYHICLLYQEVVERLLYQDKGVNQEEIMGSRKQETHHRRKKEIFRDYLISVAE